jgi:hypothetical protein
MEMFVPKQIVLLLAGLLLLISCGRDEATIPPPPTISNTTPVKSNVQTTSSVTPANTVAPVIIKNPAATVTIANPATSTPTATPTPTPKKVNLRTAADFGDSYNPLTGEEVNDSVQLNRRPLAVKISNAPPRWVRPQSGFNEADLVFEHVTEAGITRFTMIVYGKSPVDVGPIRSARLIDLELPAMYDAALVYSGSSEGVREKLLLADFRPRILFSSQPGYYRTSEDKPIEHTLYALPIDLWEQLEEKGLNRRPEFNTNMAFNSDPPAGGSTASEVTIDYDWTLINWKYNPESGHYTRWADGEPHLDQNSGDQVSASNIIVVFANHIQDPDICEQVINGECTAYSVEIFLEGTGSAVIFRDGQQYDGTWQRANRHDMLTFLDDSGQALPLQVGNSWIQVIPLWYDDPVTAKP